MSAAAPHMAVESGGQSTIYTAEQGGMSVVLHVPDGATTTEVALFLDQLRNEVAYQSAVSGEIRL